MAKQDAMNQAKKKLQSADARSSGTKRRFWLGFSVILAILMLVAASGWGGAWVQFQQVDQAIAARQFDQAEAILDRIPWWSPQPGRVPFLKARIARIRSDVEQAVLQLKVARSGGFDPDRVRCEETLVLIQNGGLDQFENQFDALIDTNPLDHAEIFEAFALAHMDQGQHDKCSVLLDRWSDDFPNDSRPFYWHGVLANDSGDDQKAAKFFSRAVELNSNALDARREWASVLDRFHQPDLAIEQHRVILQQDPSRLDSQRLIGELLWDSNQQEKAIEHFQTLLQTHPELYVANLRVAEYLATYGEPESVIETVEPMLSRFGDDERLNYFLATAYFRLLRMEKYEAAMNRFIHANRGLDRLNHNAGSIASKGDPQEVLRVAEQYQQFRQPDARRWIDMAIQLDPNSAAAYQLLAKNAYHSGQTFDYLRAKRAAEQLTVNMR